MDLHRGAKSHGAAKCPRTVQLSPVHFTDLYDKSNYNFRSEMYRGRLSLHWA